MKKILILFTISLHFAVSFPMKLLKVPKIYNALITTNQKLLPSEAFPASTGTVFEPIGLTGDPVLLNPEAFMKQSSGEEASALGEAPRPFSKMPTPLVFYPRYNVYHQPPQSVFPYDNVYQPPPIVVPVQRSQSSDAIEPSGVDERIDAPSEAPVQPSPQPPQAFGFVTNNKGRNSNIPDVPPPLPPVGAPRPAEEQKEEEPSS